MEKKQKVHITDSEGKLLFTQLYDSGNPILRFESGYGFVDRYEIKRRNWKIKSGWPKTQAEKSPAPFEKK